jgi:hypothetical protein
MIWLGWVGLLGAAFTGYLWGIIVTLRQCKKAVQTAFDDGHKAGYQRGTDDAVAYLDAGPV